MALSKKAKLDLDSESFPFYGNIKINESGFAFVDFNGIGIYVPPKLLKDKEFNNLDKVKGMFVSSFDKKKKKAGYTAVEISKID